VTGTLLPGFALDVVVVAGVAVVAGVVLVAGVVAARVAGVAVGAAVVVVVGSVVVVAAVVGGVVAVGAAVALVVGVTRREEEGRLAFVALVEFTAPVDRCAAPFPLGPIVRSKAVTNATAPTVAPTIATLLWFSDSVSVGGSPASGTGGDASRASMAGLADAATIGESSSERSACGRSPLSISRGSCGLRSCHSNPSLVTGRATSRSPRWCSSWPRYAAGYDVAAESRRGLSSGEKASCDVLPASLTRRVGFPSREK
jgi:hypothetical protein